MSRILSRASRRHFLHHPWQLGLSILGVALGVAVVLSIDLANASALRAFRLSSETLGGRASHRIEAGSRGLPEDLYRELRVEAALEDTAPVVEGWLRAGEPPRSLRLLGLDPFAEGAFRRWADIRLGWLDAARPDGLRLLTQPATVALTPATAAALGVRPGDELLVTIAGRRLPVDVVGLLPDEPSGALDDVLLADVATAQELLGMVGRLTRIDLAAPPEPERAGFLAAVAARLPDAVTLRPAGAAVAAAETMTRAFRTNLQALSLLALMCGTFLIYNTIGFTVVQRRRIFGVLRCLGATRGQLAVRIAAETLTIGALGTALGLLLGAALGRSLVAEVTQTINDLYFAVAVREVAIQPVELIKASILGLAASLLAATPPAIEALGARPRAALDRSEVERSAHRAVAIAAGLALAAGLSAALLLSLPGAALAASFGGLFAALLALALLTPLATLAFLRLATPLAARLLGPIGRLAGRGLARSLSRTAVAIAALMIAISVAVGVDLMIRSFRTTVVDWLELSLPADLYVSSNDGPRAASSAARGGIAPEVAAALSSLPEVGGLNAVRDVEVADGGGARLRLRAFDLDARGRRAFRIVGGVGAEVWPAFEAGAVLVSEPLAYRRRLVPGDELRLRTDAGERSFAIAGVFTDFATDQGAVMMARSRYAELWRDRELTALSLYAAPGVEPASLHTAARRLLRELPALRLRSNAEIKRDSLAVFDRTFVVTGVLRLLAIIVAVAGILSALTALILERQRELAVLRAHGLTPRQLWLLVLSETGLMGLVAGLLALPAGVAMAQLMIEVINRRSFGWSMEMTLTAAPLAGALALAVAAALGAGLLPALRAARIVPAEALRGE